MDVGVGAGSREQQRQELIGRVRARRPELEAAIRARIRSSAHTEIDESDAEYAAGLRAAVTAGIEHALGSMEGDPDASASASAPLEAIVQAQRAARLGVSVEIMVRRYVLGSNLIGDFLMQEAHEGGLLLEQGETVRKLLNALSAILDRLLSAITDAYNKELAHAGRSPERRRAERVLRLLAGDRGGLADLGYEIERWHLGVIAVGPAARGALKGVAASTGAQLLCVSHGEDTAWAWLGASSVSLARKIESALAEPDAAPALLATGEPGRDLDGWRLSHLQAQAALRVALCSLRPVTRYADVALVASVLRDDALARSLVDIYLAPLGSIQNGGGMLRETLRAYFAAQCNASSAASALGVSRHTVENRLRSIEGKLGQAMRTRRAELEVALRVEQLDQARSHSD